MIKCVECGSKINVINPEQGAIIDCLECGIELEISENNVRGLQLGPSEE
ncbi:MAG: lysine biosynthesis protein LysW [Petrotogales bacterium]